MLGHEQALKAVGLEGLGTVHWNLFTARLYEEAIRRGEARLSRSGALVIDTAPYTGRLPKDKFIVREPSCVDKIAWGAVNQPFAPEKFDALQKRVTGYLRGKPVYIQDCYAGADEQFQIPVRVISERPVGALFARTMFIREHDPSKLANQEEPFTVIHVPDFKAVPAVDGTRSEAFILLHFGKRMVLIGGTAYCGEIKKSVFSIMNYLLPQRGILPMHCSANYGRSEEDAVIFFGLSGTGKTTLSAEIDRTLVGDDEHGWSDSGIFNFEGGCYAKLIRLTQADEPEIFETTRRFGTLLENVVMNPVTREIDLGDASLSENTRGSYPVSFISNMTMKGKCGHPKNIIMLTCDAFGILPPVAHLSTEQALYHFLAGYTAKVAGTESGVVEPQATFSPCFGGPFMPLAPETYAALLKKKILAHQADVWLVNTGWSGGPYGTGSRIKISVTRAIVHAILKGLLRQAPKRKDPLFGLEVPTACPEVPPEILDPRNTWKDPAAYDQKARSLAAMFQQHFLETAPGAPPEIKAAGPKLS